MKPVKQPVIRVDLRKFIYVDNVRIGRAVFERRSIQIFDKDRRRSAVRGTRTVEVSVDALVKLMEPQTH